MVGERQGAKWQGVLITFEGPDGAGKTTQLQRVSRFLREHGVDVEVTREPGGTPLGEAIRQWLLSPPGDAGQEMAFETEVLLYAASRAQHVRERLLPALRAGKVVLCDRYVDASYAYQAYGNQLPLRWVEEVNRLAVQEVMPTRTYLLDLPVELARRRLKRREGDGMDRIERRGEAYHQRVREGFLTMARHEPERILVIDASASEEEVARRILDDLREILRDRLTGSR